MSELKNHHDLWTRLLGDPLPPPDTFVYWVANFSDEVIRYAISRTAAKSLKLGTMDADYRIRYCSHVMRSRLKDLQRVQKMRAAAQATRVQESNSIAEVYDQQ